MTRLYIVTEGQSKERFVTDVLGPHLGLHAVWAHPVTVTTRKDRRRGTQHRGGGAWQHWANDLRRLFKQHQGSDVRFTTLFDLYGLPGDFPELSTHRRVADTVRRAELLEQAMAAELHESRFVPYLQRHEFEALVLASLDALHELLDPSERPGLEALRASLGTLAPEDVNDGEATAPSKRLVQHITSYKKRASGPSAIGAAGLPRVRAACPRFDRWLTGLEGLATGASG